MSENIRLKINDVEVSIPSEMVGRDAAAIAAEQLGDFEGDLRLCRVADHMFVGDVVPVGQVLADGDELELVPFSNN
jgi:hypothetical protein